MGCIYSTNQWLLDSGAGSSASTSRQGSRGPCQFFGELIQPLLLARIFFTDDLSLEKLIFTKLFSPILTRILHPAFRALFYKCLLIREDLALHSKSCGLWPIFISFFLCFGILRTVDPAWLGDFSRLLESH